MLYLVCRSGVHNRDPWRRASSTTCRLLHSLLCNCQPLLLFCCLSTGTGGSALHSSLHAFCEIRGFGSGGSKPWSSQTNDFKIDIFRFLARCSALIGYDKKWFAECQDNGITGNSAGILVSQWAALYSCHECAMPQVGTYDFKCC